MWPFDWWKPKCPVGYRQKAWVELRMRWLAEEFGTKQLTQCKIILPTEEYFPDPFDQTPEAARRLLDRICGYMGVYPAEIDLQVQPKDCTCGTAGSYPPGVIRVADSQLADPMALAATLAHELAHHVLIQRKLLEGGLDREWTTDLTTVVFGLGIFVANATVSEKHACGGRSSWSSISKQGYLPARTTAYAMALQAWLCGEERADWVGHLRHDAAEAFDAGLRYLVRTEDSLLRPDNLHHWDKNPSLDRLLGQLEQGTASQRVAVLWQLAQRGPAAGAVASSVALCLTDSRPGICAEAARALAEMGPVAEIAIPDLVDVMGHPDDEVRMAAAYALGKLHLQPELVVPELAEHLGDPGVLETAAWALAQFGDDAQPALPRLLARLKSELGRGHGAIDFLVYAVRAISPDAEADFRELIESCDADLQQQAGELIPEDGPMIPNPPGRSSLWFWET
jgi:hypothetical protein